MNRALTGTQSLLTEATKQSERLRISRNIHDVVGHHLTALTIHLQVAARLSEGDAKKAVEQSHAIARLLLGDVREAVSEIRDNTAIDLQAALAQMTQGGGGGGGGGVPRLAIELDYDPQLVINEVRIAEVLVRAVQEAITNTLKHGIAENLRVSLALQENTVVLAMKDDGCRSNEFQPGNGLVGMRERVEALNGLCVFEAASPHFCITIKVPCNP